MLSTLSVLIEAQHAHPLDLCARIDWLYGLADSATPEDRDTILQAVAITRNGSVHDRERMGGRAA